MVAYPTPGVYRVERFPAPPRGLRTGVPAFLGYTSAGPPAEPVALDLVAELEARFGKPPPVGYLHAAVRCSSETEDGTARSCALDETVQPEQAVADALAALEAVDDVDLICAPDLPRARPPGELPSLPPDPTRIRVLQGLVLDHCDRLGNRFALLDSLPNAGQGTVLAQRGGSSGRTAALYYPWVQAARRGRPDELRTTVRPRRRRLRADGRARRRSQGTCERGARGGRRPRARAERRAAGRAEPVRGQLPARVPGPRHPCLGRADAELRSRVEARQRAAAVPHRCPLDRPQSRGGRRSRRTIPRSGRRIERELSAYLRGALSSRRSARRNGRGGVLRQMRRGDEPARGPGAGPRRHRDRAGAGLAE